MKNIKALTVIALASTIALNANADTDKSIKRAGAFTAPTIAGAMIGGPAGMMIGAFSGIFLSEHAAKKHDEEILAEIELAEKNAALATAEAELKRSIRLQTPILFGINSDELTDNDIAQLREVAEHLKSHPEQTVSLNAYADPIGSEKYNKTLSEKRALSVAEALTRFGVSEEQIESYSHGERSDIKDTDLFAFERRVDIELNNGYEQFASTK